MSEHEPRPVPKALIYGLVGGFLLFLVILGYIVLNREKLTPEAPKEHQSSESKSASPPQ